MSSLVKKTDGELLAKRIHDAMWEQRLSVTTVAKRAKLSIPTVYKYLRLPGKAPVALLLRICKAVGIQQITLMTAGTYYDK